ncbi:hypothetical protein F-VV57_0163 [Faustovirus]|nr:hypothetical protein F-VV57_0163 [Faustovirus]QJX73430.1 hypothetical protein F-VV63_0164 [Faustovirus]
METLPAELIHIIGAFTGNCGVAIALTRALNRHFHGLIRRPRKSPRLIEWFIKYNNTAGVMLYLHHHYLSQNDHRYRKFMLDAVRKRCHRDIIEYIVYHCGLEHGYGFIIKSHKFIKTVIRYHRNDVLDQMRQKYGDIPGFRHLATSVTFLNIPAIKMIAASGPHPNQYIPANIVRKFIVRYDRCTMECRKSIRTVIALLTSHNYIRQDDVVSLCRKVYNWYDDVELFAALMKNYTGNRIFLKPPYHRDDRPNINRYTKSSSCFFT